MPARLLALLLAFLMTPVAAELIETGVHLVEHGDLGHLAAHDDAPPGGDEHGCSAVFHVCGCHASSALLRVTVAADASPDTYHLLAALALHGHRGRGEPPPPLRPPIA